MDTIMGGPERAAEESAVQRSGGGGMLILPWTKQILCVLWEHLRLLLHVVYYSFVAVFQMFRLEVHLRITDETGRPRVQHVSASGSPAESFLLSSLFDGNGGVFIPGSESLSKGGLNAYAGGSHAGALLSNFGADDLCLSLVDDFVIRAQESLSEDAEDELCLGHHPAWTQKGPADWEVLVSEECRRKEEACCSRGETVIEKDSLWDVVETVPDPDASVEKVDCFWDEGEAVPDPDARVEEADSLWDVVETVPDPDASVEKVDCFWDEGEARVEEADSWDEEDEVVGEEFDEEESRALWDSFTKSSDPYYPLSFSACLSTSSDNESESTEGWDRELPRHSPEDGSTLQPLRKYHLDLVRPGPESESDWHSSDDSSAADDDDDDEEENERLWELFASPLDPYNPLNFTACADSSIPEVGVREAGVLQLAPAPSPSDSGESDRPPSQEELWNSFSQSADPYHPLHFRACLQSCPPFTPPPLQRAGRSKPRLSKRRITPHSCVRTSRERWTLTPWRKPGSAPATRPHTAQTLSPKKVRFSPLLQVHVIRAWSFAMQAVRKGPWEEMGRDRARFQRRVQETEHAIGYCLHQSHRAKMLDYLTHSQNAPPVLRL